MLTGLLGAKGLKAGGATVKAEVGAEGVSGHGNPTPKKEDVLRHWHRTAHIRHALRPPNRSFCQEQADKGSVSEVERYLFEPPLSTSRGLLSVSACALSSAFYAANDATGERQDRSDFWQHKV